MSFLEKIRQMIGRTADEKKKEESQSETSDASQKAIEFFDKLSGLKQFILIGENSDSKPFIWDSGEPDNEFLADCREVIKSIIIERIGRERYDENIDRMDMEIGQLYRESDYHMARAEWLDAELRYYKEANDPGGLGGNQLMNMWQRVLETRRVFEEIEKEVKRENGQ